MPVVFRISSRRIGFERALRFGPAAPFDIGRIRQQQSDPRLTQFGEARRIEALAVHRRVVDLEIAGVDDHSGRRINRQCQRIGGRMRHPQRLDLKGSDCESFRAGGWCASPIRGPARAPAGVGGQPPIVNSLPYTATG